MPDLGKSGMVRMAFSMSAAVGGEWIMLKFGNLRSRLLKRTRYLAGSRGNRQSQIEESRYAKPKRSSTARRGKTVSRRLELSAPAEEGAGYQGLPGPSSAYQDLPYAFRDWMDGV